MHAVLIEFRRISPYPIALANALGDLCQVTLMLPETTTESTELVDGEKVSLRLFGMPRYRQLANLGMIWRLRQQLTTMRPDLVHITHWHVWATPVLGLLSPLPLVVTVHDVHPHPGDGGRQAIPSVLYPWQWRWADQTIVHSRAARQELLASYRCHPDRVHASSIGAYDLYRTYARRGQQERANTVLFFGRIWGYKGLECLLSAEPLITQAVPGARIVIAGKGEPLASYEQVMADPYHFEVHNYHIPDEMVAELFQSASVVVLPYIEASQSGVIPIAYAFGKPVVASSVGGIPEVVDHGQTGLLVPPGDPNSLAEAVIRLLKDRELRLEMGRKAREKADNELSWSAIARRTLQVYDKATSPLTGD